MRHPRRCSLLGRTPRGCDRIGLLERSPAPVAGPPPATLNCRSLTLTCPPATTTVPTSRRVSLNAVSNRKNERWYRSASITACSIAAASDTRGRPGLPADR